MGWAREGCGAQTGSDDDEVGSFAQRAWRGQSGAGVEEPLGE